jgi:hypothetical protein
MTIAITDKKDFDKQIKNLKIDFQIAVVEEPNNGVMVIHFEDKHFSFVGNEIEIYKIYQDIFLPGGEV